MSRSASRTPGFFELFTPKLVSTLREGYGLPELRRDAIAGLTVAIVALPLSMAIAIAAGVTPDRGLYTAIVGGFLVSALGGSRHQIGGPAGAFIVLIAAIVERQGFDGLALATIMAGLGMLALGYLRLGTYIRFIPYPVTVGFTAGIATIIFASQLKELLGLNLAKEPAALIPKLEALWQAAPSVTPAAVGLSVGSILVIAILRRLRPHWPGFLIAVVLASLIAIAFKLDVATIGSRFGGVPSALPAPHLPALSFERILALLPDAAAIMLLGSIESLLSAMVADGMSGRRHRSDCELVAQGFANIGAALFGGFCVTGTIARTATNVRAGAHGPLAGIFHALYLLVFMLVAAPLMSLVPLAALGAVLAVVCWNMADKHEFLALSRASVGDALVLFATFLLTVFVDLTTGIVTGTMLASLLFMHRMAHEVEIAGIEQAPLYDEAEQLHKGVAVFRITGPFFFGSTATAGSTFDRIGEHPKRFILDFAAVPFVDSTGASTLAAFVTKLRKRGTEVIFSAVPDSVRRTLAAQHVDRAGVIYMPDLAAALAIGQPAE